jgi:hypothetical protein
MVSPEATSYVIGVGLGSGRGVTRPVTGSPAVGVRLGVGVRYGVINIAGVEVAVWTGGSDAQAASDRPASSEKATSASRAIVLGGNIAAIIP